LNTNRKGAALSYKVERCEMKNFGWWSAISISTLKVEKKAKGNKDLLSNYFFFCLLVFSERNQVALELIRNYITWKFIISYNF